MKRFLLLQKNTLTLTASTDLTPSARFSVSKMPPRVSDTCLVLGTYETFFYLTRRGRFWPQAPSVPFGRQFFVRAEICDVARNAVTNSASAVLAPNAGFGMPALWQVVSGTGPVLGTFKAFLHVTRRGRFWPQTASVRCGRQFFVFAEICDVAKEHPNTHCVNCFDAKRKIRRP